MPLLRTSALLLAAIMQSNSSTNLILYDVPKVLGEINITAEANQEITAEHGIRIIIPSDLYAIWDQEIGSIYASGPAVNSGKLSGTIEAQYPGSTAKTIFIPVLQDFVSGESVQINGLGIRVFNRGNGLRYLQLDLNADGIADTYDLSGIRIDDTASRSDGTAPGTVSDLKVVQSEEGIPTLSWTNPPELDIIRADILRKRTRAGVVTETNFYVNLDYTRAGQMETYIDADVQTGDQLEYLVTVVDYRFNSPAESVLLVAGEMESTVTEEIPPVIADEEVEEVSETETILSRYSDIAADHWSAEYLARLTKDEIISGYPDGTIQPDKTINRAELAKMAVNAFDLTGAVPTTNSYIDVQLTAWFHDFVELLKINNAAWTSSKYYRPSLNVTREEALWVLVQAAGVDTGNQPASAPFPDVSQASKYAASIDWSVKNGIVSGYENGNFGPKDIITRAQVAKIIFLLQDLTP